MGGVGRETARIAARALVERPAAAVGLRRGSWFGRLVGGLTLVLVIPTVLAGISNIFIGVWPELAPLWMLLPALSSIAGGVSLLALVLRGRSGRDVIRTIASGVRGTASVTGGVLTLGVVATGIFGIYWLWTNGIGWAAGAALALWIVLTALCAYTAGARRDKAARAWEHAFHGILASGSLKDWEGRTYRAKNGNRRARIPDGLGIDLTANPERFDTRASNWRDGSWEIVRVSSTVAELRPAVPEKLELRRIAKSSDGMIVAIGEPNRTGRRTLQLSESFRGTRDAVDALDHWVGTELPGEELLDLRVGTREASTGALDSETREIRSLAAAALPGSTSAFQVTASVRRDVDGHRLIELGGEILRSLDRAGRRKAAAEIVVRLPPAGNGMEWKVRFNDRDGTISLQERVDPLGALITLSDFRAAHPLGTDPHTSWKRFDVAIDEHGRGVSFNFFHTLVVGQTGAGKGSILWSILGGILPSARAGLAQIYAVDPKGAEAIASDGSPHSAFHQVATKAEEWAPLIRDVVKLMEARKGNGRKLAVTREMPLIVLFVDELLALSKLDSDAKRRAQVASDLMLILSQGRSLNVLVVAAVQVPQKSLIGDFRDFMPMRVALRTATAIETDLILGEGATVLGAEAHKIPVATEGNGYWSAGTGYMQVEGDPTPLRIRFPFTSDADLDALHAEFKALRAAGQLPTQIEPASASTAPVFGERVNSPQPVVDLGVIAPIDLSDFDFDEQPETAVPVKPSSPLGFGLDFS